MAPSTWPDPAPNVSTSSAPQGTAPFLPPGPNPRPNPTHDASLTKPLLSVSSHLSPALAPSANANQSLQVYSLGTALFLNSAHGSTAQYLWGCGCPRPAFPLGRVSLLLAEIPPSPRIVRTVPLLWTTPPRELTNSLFAHQRATRTLLRLRETRGGRSVRHGAQTQAHPCPLPQPPTL